MANTKTLLDLLALRAALAAALASDTGEHAAEIAEEIEVITAEIEICIAAD